MSRTATRSRATKETSISITVNLDGTGLTAISTGIPFYDHMLDQLGRHGGFDLTIDAVGDLQIDTHHTVEDVAITLGETFREALVEVALDLSGRPFVVWDVQIPECLPLGNPAFDPQLAEHAVHSLSLIHI